MLGSDCKGSLVADFKRKLQKELELNLSPAKAITGLRDVQDDVDIVPVLDRRSSLRVVRSLSFKEEPAAKSPARQKEEPVQTSKPVEDKVNKKVPLVTSKVEVRIEPLSKASANPGPSNSAGKDKAEVTSGKKKGKRGKGDLQQQLQQPAAMAESLGIDVPSIKNLLAFNNLGKRAHLYGSSVSTDRSKSKRRKKDSPSDEEDR